MAIFERSEARSVGLSPEYCASAKAIVLLEDSIVAPQVRAVCNSRNSLLVDLHCTLYGRMALLSISIFLPVSKTERIFSEESIIHLAYPCDISLQVDT